MPATGTPAEASAPGVPAHRFRVVLLRPPNFRYVEALSDAAEHLLALLDARAAADGGPATAAGGGIDPGAVNLVFGAHLLAPGQGARLPLGSILFNTEPLDAGWAAENAEYRRLLSRHYVWDYSPLNLRRLPHSAKAMLPFLRRPMPPPPAPREPGSYLYFYGHHTPRRRLILDRLRALGVPVREDFGVFGDERDACALRSRAVLNLGQRDGPRPFEQVRCAHSLNLGVPVLTEAAPDDPAWALFAPFVAAADGDEADHLAEGLASLWHDPGFEADSTRRLAAFAAVEPLCWLRRALRGYEAWRSALPADAVAIGRGGVV